MIKLRPGQTSPSQILPRDTKTAKGGEKTAPTPQKQSAPVTARTARAQDGFQAARAAPVALTATAAPTPYREVLPQHATQAAVPGQPLGDAALDRVLAHVEGTINRRLSDTERAAWKNEARELSKQGGTEDDLWGATFSKFHFAQQNTAAGQHVRPSAVGTGAQDGQPLNEAALDRVLAHVETTLNRHLSPTERAAWKNEARELSKKGGTESDVWGEVFSKFHFAQQATTAGQHVMPSAASKVAQDGQPLNDAALDRVLAHVETTLNRHLSPTERAAWKNEARELSKKGGTESDVWGEVFSRFHFAQQATTPGQHVLPSAASKVAQDGQPLNDAALDRVLEHVERTVGRRLTPNERAAWKNEARELSKKGGSESDVWGEVFSKFYKADKNVNGTR